MPAALMTGCHFSISSFWNFASASGLDMLAWQAIGTWELWLGPIEAEKARTEVKNDLMKHLRANP